MNYEKRIFGSTLEVRTHAGKSSIHGRAAVFNTLSFDLGGFKERIMPGAFAESIENGDDVSGLWQHDPRFVLGRRKNDTLDLEEDKVGLRYVARPPDATFAKDAVAQIAGGYVDQSSFGFQVPVDGEKWSVEEGENIRTLVNVALKDVSPVTFPAYPGTDAEARSAADAIMLQAGIDVGLLARVLVRYERKLPLEDGDVDVLRGQAETLREMAKNPWTAGPEAEGLDRYVRRLTLLGHAI